MKSGDQIQLVDNLTHKTFLGVIKSTSPLDVFIQEPILEDVELSKDVTLFFALAKSDKIDFVIQKATELGAKRIILFQGKRSIVKYTQADFARKKDRYVSIAKEASEQQAVPFAPRKRTDGATGTVGRKEEVLQIT